MKLPATSYGESPTVKEGYYFYSLANPTASSGECARCSVHRFRGFMKCPLCHKNIKEKVELGFTLFRHFGFVDSKENGAIGRCSQCQLIFNMLNPEEIKKLDKLYGSPDYAQSGVTNQTFYVKEYGKRVTRSFLQAEILSKYLTADEPVILDIGCFNGTLLREFFDRYPEAELHGFDVNEYLRQSFPSGSKFHFWSSRIEDIKGKFDLICMSHSMMYIKNINGLLNRIQKLLKHSGMVFIQTPDIRKNPHSILLSDQYYHYTPSILKNIFKIIGFDFSLFDNEWFPRDIVGIAQTDSRDKSLPFREDLSIYDCIEQLHEKKSKLNSISSRRRYGVLGTTIAAAFVDSVLGNRIEFFADEETERIGINFRGKKVIHPSSIEKSDYLVIPYGASNKSIKKRFSKEYGLTLFETL